MKKIIIIPARYDSTRLPGKLLLDIAGKPMIQHVYERAQFSNADDIVIAADDERIVAAAKQFDANVIMTKPKHKSGSERLGEAIETLGCADDDLIINVQGDEPLIPIEHINAVIAASESQVAAITTVAVPLGSVDDVLNPNIVKVVLNERQRALYFSRAPIPWGREHYPNTTTVVDGTYHHIGIYGYTARYLRLYLKLPAGPLEQAEKLEQLRALWHGDEIYVAISSQPEAPGVDTEADLAVVRDVLGG